MWGKSMNSVILSEIHAMLKNHIKRLNNVN